MTITVITGILLLGLGIVQAQFAGEQIAFCKIILRSFAYE